MSEVKSGLNFIAVKTQETIYGYLGDADSKYACREEYPFQVTVNYKSEDSVYVSKLMARVPVTAEDIENLREFGRRMGIKEVEYERGGKKIIEIL